MRRLLYVLGLCAVCIGCSSDGGTGTIAARPTPTPTSVMPSDQSLCHNAPTLAVPGTYPFFASYGVLSGTNFTIDPDGTFYLYQQISAASPSPSASPTSTPTPNPSASPYDIWSGTVTYAGTPHDSTVCFLASALVSRGSYDEGAAANNSEVFSQALFGTSDLNFQNLSFGNVDTVQNFVLQLSTTSPTSGSFTLAGGGHASISITEHAVYTDAEARRAIDAAIAAHKLPGPLR